MKSLLDPTFRYTPAEKTDVRATFERVRKEQEAEREAAKKIAHLPRPQTKGQA